MSVINAAAVTAFNIIVVKSVGVNNKIVIDIIRETIR